MQNPISQVFRQNQARKDGDSKSWSSNPLWSHLKTKHVEDHRKAIEDRDKAVNKPENVQKLLFLKYSLRMLNYNL